MEEMKEIQFSAATVQCSTVLYQVAIGIQYSSVLDTCTL